MINITVNTTGVTTLWQKIRNRARRSEKILAAQVMKDTEPYVPALSGSLSLRTRLEGSEIVYPGPYARYLYYGKVTVDSKTGKGPMNIPGVGPRFHKGATLVPTDRDLKFSKSMHPLATSHWIEASKAQNIEKWQRVAGRLISNGDR